MTYKRNLTDLSKHYNIKLVIYKHKLFKSKINETRRDERLNTNEISFRSEPSLSLNAV